MKKKRQKRGAHLVSHGHYSGVNWTEYRYGEKKPVTLAGPKPRPILKGDKRDHVVNEVMDRLRDWRLSPFENEADCVHGLRQGLCLDGHSFARSEQEAASVVAEGLRLLGAQRPDWQEGQWEYAISPDYCAGCHGPIDDADRAKGFRFCSPECARGVYEDRGYRHIRKHNAIAQSAYNIIQTDLAPPLECAHCKRTFKRMNAQYEGRYSRQRAHQYCGKACAAAAMTIHQPRECKVCSKTFKPRYERQLACSTKCAHVLNIKPANATCSECGKGFRVPPSRKAQRGKWCSLECRAQSMRKIRIPAECEWCGESYMAKNKLAKYCSIQCRDHFHLYKNGKWMPSKMTRRNFDAFFTKPINALPRGKRMTAQSLDWLFMEQGLRITAEVKVAA